MRDLKVKRVVIKVGTNTICTEDGNVDQAYIEGLARQVLELEKQDVQSIIVTSGAIGSGSTELGLDGCNKDVAMKQACAAVGQATLMMVYRDAFRRHGKTVGQVLLTYGAFSDRIRYLNLKKAIDQMFALGVVPIVNENDVIATDEIDEGFGDNDKLSAMVASKMDADLLVLLTDVDGLYDRNPEADADAKLIPTVDEITKDIEAMAGTKKNERSTGGMRTKINAARIAMQSGCNMIIANGRAKDIVVRLVNNEEIGTMFTGKTVYSNKERWILFAAPKGKIEVDDGAERAVKKGRSLLICGITAVEGKFKEGDVIRIGAFAKGIANYSSNGLAEQVQRCQVDDNVEKKNGGVAIDHVNMVFYE